MKVGNISGVLWGYTPSGTRPRCRAGRGGEVWRVCSVASVSCCSRRRMTLAAHDQLGGRKGADATREVFDLSPAPSGRLHLSAASPLSPPPLLCSQHNNVCQERRHECAVPQQYMPRAAAPPLTICFAPFRLFGCVLNSTGFLLKRTSHGTHFVSHI